METLDIVATAATPVAIVALVNLFKELGLPQKLGLLLAVFLGVGLSLADWAWASEGWYQAASSGLILGLGASGIHDLVKPKRALVVPAERVVDLDPPPEASGR